MKFKRSCRDVTRLVLEGEDRALTPGERWGVYFHMWICAACPAFRQQVSLMRRSMGRWRRYAEGDRPLE